MIGFFASFVIFQAQQPPPLRFLVSHRDIPDVARKLLDVPVKNLESEAAKLSFSVRRQSDSLAIYSNDLYDVKRVDLALKGQRALAELVRQKRRTFTLGEFTGETRSGLAELIKGGAPVAGTAAFDPQSTISIGFHYYVTLEANGKRIDDVISLEPPYGDKRAGEPSEGEVYADPSPPPNITKLFVITEGTRTPSQRRARALAELMEYFGEVVEKQNEDIVKTFAMLEDAGAWEQTIVQGMATKGLDEPQKKTLLSSLATSMQRFGFKDKNEVDRFVDGARISKVRRAPSLRVTGVVGGQRRTVNFSATVNRGG